MKIEFEYTFGLPRKIVWKYIKDEDILSKAIKGSRSFKENKKGVYHAELEVNVGPIKDVFKLGIQVEKEKAPSIIYLVMKGKGNLGEVSGSAILQLSDMEGSTKIIIMVDCQISGALAGASKRILNGGANTLIEEFLQRVEKEIKRSLYLMRKGKKV